MKGISVPRAIATAYNGQTDEFNVLRYGEAVDDLLDRINEGTRVIVTSGQFQSIEIEYETDPMPGTYRLVAWEDLGGDK